MGVWTGSSWLRIGTGTCKLGNEISGLHKMRGISLQAENGLASQEGLCSRNKQVSKLVSR